MRTIEKTFQTLGASVLLIGLKGESNATEILIDCADALEEYQGTMAAMSITGPDGTVYPGDINLDENGIVHWVVAARDCAIEGHGSVRIDLVDDDGTNVASAEADTMVIKTNMKNIAPDQIENWTVAASVALQEVRAALLDLTGAPTDEQVEIAVDAWLDEHPEATTTVEDFSLTANKFVKGAFGYVVPQQFGAKGDGQTDDTNALKSCIDYAMANHCAVFLPSGTYIVQGYVMDFYIGSGQSIVIFGEGQKSLVKRKDNSLNGNKWSILFHVRIAADNGDAKDVIFSNFCIDSNRRNQGDIPADSYAYENSMDISIRNESGTYFVDRFIVSDMRFYDPVADCVNVSGTSAKIRINHILIDKIIATGRQGTRNDIGFTANHAGDTIISNCVCTSLHFEFNNPFEKSDWYDYVISNCYFDVFSISANIRMFMRGCIINRYLVIQSCPYSQISDCKIAFVNDGNYIGNIAYARFWANVIFNDCEFIITKTNNSIMNLSLREGVDVEFQNCRFIYDGEYDLDADSDGVNDHIIGYPVFEEHSSSGKFIMDGCFVDPAFTAYVRNYASHGVIRNCDIGCLYGIEIGTQSASRTDSSLDLDNVSLLPSCKKLFNVSISDGSGKGMTINGEVKCLISNFDIMFYNDTQRKHFIANTKGNFRRIIEMDLPFSFENTKQYVTYHSYYNRYVYILFKNDIFKYIGDNPKLYPSQWKVNERNVLETKDGETSLAEGGIPLSENLISYGFANGGTKQRPECVKSPGFHYFDDGFGRDIVWNGSNWNFSDGSIAPSLIDASGAVVSFSTEKTSDAINSMKVNLLPLQSGSGDPSPQNIRPISGWTEINLTNTGKNIFDYQNAVYQSGIRNDQGEDVSDSNSNYTRTYTRVKPSTEYVISGNPLNTSGYGSRIYFLDAAKNWISRTAGSYSGSQWFKFTTPSNCHFIQIQAHKNSDLSTWQIEEGSSQTSYQSFGATEDIDWENSAGTIYGGYVDPLNGKVVATYGNIASYAGETIPGEWISDRDVYAPDSTPTTGAQVVYKLSTPVETNITPVSLSTVTGVNTIWSDVGTEIELDYWTN